MLCIRVDRWEGVVRHRGWSNLTVARDNKIEKIKAERQFIIYYAVPHFS